MAANGSIPSVGLRVGASLPPSQMSCAEFEREVPLYVDGELGETERVELELHLRRCAPCRSGVHYARALRERLQEANRELVGSAVCASESLRKSIDAAIRNEAGASRAGLLSRLRHSFWRPIPVAAGATAMGLTAWFWLIPPPQDETFVRELAARHVRRLPLEVHDSDPRSLERWLADKVDFKVRVPRPAGSMGLVGARLSHVRDHSAVYLLYGNAQADRQVAIIVYDDASSQPPRAGTPRIIDDREVYMANARGYNVALWKQNEVVYSLVSDGQDEIIEFVRALNER